MKTLRIILIVVYIFISTFSFGQAIKTFNPDQIGEENLINVVYLYSRANTAINYSVSLDSKNWQNEKLKAFGDIVFKAVVYARLGTENKIDVYLLQIGNRYFIKWDASEKKYVILRKEPEK
jgi:chloramphenicol O-acetyltransferase